MAENKDRAADISAEVFAMWKHHPVTEVFFNFLADQHAAWRELAADLVETGWLDPTERREDFNPNVIRGRLAVVSELQELTIEGICDFYSAEEAAKEQALNGSGATKAHKGPAG